jgi:hypothetical protein
MPLSTATRIDPLIVFSYMRPRIPTWANVQGTGSHVFNQFGADPINTLPNLMTVAMFESEKQYQRAVRALAEVARRKRLDFRVPIYDKSEVRKTCIILRVPIHSPEPSSVG